MRFARLPILVLVAALPACAALPGRELRAVVADRGGAFRAWDYNVAIFETRADALFRGSPEGQRQELRRRIAYARRMGAAERRALDGLLTALDRLMEAPIGAGARGRRRVALVGAVAAFERYGSLFGEALHRALGLYPRPPHQRMLDRWDEGHDERLLLTAEDAFLDAAERFVTRTAALMEVRRRRFYDALRNLQYTAEVLDLTLQSQLDRTFFLLQGALAEPLEPGMGPPDYQEFPVGHPFAPVLAPRPSAHALTFEGLRYPQGAAEKLARSRDPGALVEEVLAREAWRSKELQDLAARFQEVQLGREPGRVEELWKAYVELRDRWRRVE